MTSWFASLLNRNRKEIENTAIISPPASPSKANMSLVSETVEDNKQIPISDFSLPKDRAADGQVALASITRFFGDEFSPYSHTIFRGLYVYDEPSLYRDYQESYTQNPFTHMVVEYLMNECFANDYHFEGPGAKVVEKFFSEDNTRAKIKMAWREAIKKGNGFMDVGRKRKSAVRTRVLNTDEIEIELDDNGLRVYKQDGKKLNSDLMVHFMVKEESANPYGISPLRANIVFLTALLDVGGDILSALKRVAYAPIIAQLDLENYTEAEKEVYLAAWRDKMKNIKSAEQNFVVDKRHDVRLLGEGAAGARLLPTNQLIEPIIAVILMNFGIPLGMYLQTGANKAIIDEQRKAMQRFYEDLRTKIKFHIETQVVPHITGRQTVLVFNKPPLSNEQTQREFEVLISGYQNGILSREYILDHMNIEDSGTTFFTQGPENEESEDEDGATDEEGDNEENQEE